MNPMKKFLIVNGVQMNRIPLPNGPVAGYVPSNTVVYVGGQDMGWTLIYVGSIAGDHGWVPPGTQIVPAGWYGWSDDIDRPQSVHVLSSGGHNVQRVYISSSGRGVKPVRVVRTSDESAEPIVIVSMASGGAHPVYVVNPAELPREYRR